MNKIAHAVLIIVSFALFNPAPLVARELDMLGGLIVNNKNHDKSYSWELLYKEDLNHYLAWSFGWNNEGHFPGHHRDGQTIQIWIHADALNSHWSLAAGAGPYLSFDTARTADRGHKDAHDWGTVASFSTTYYTQTPWLVKFAANHIWERNNFNTTSILIGVGYRFYPCDASEAISDKSIQHYHWTNNEITIFYGRTILNSFRSESSSATEIEYRRKVFPYLDWTLGWIYEGDLDISRRNGIASQIWPTRHFLDNRLSLGLGLGAYAAVDEKDNEDFGEGGEAYLTGLLTITAGYNIRPFFLVRISWNRTVTNYDTDTDILLAGIGYRF